MKARHKARLLLVASAVVFLAACDSAEERAEKHFQNAVELIEGGDVTRGMIELRNALQLDDAHRDARWLFAEQLLAQGRTQEAFGQFLNVAERFPEEAEPRIIVAELALDSRQWELVERHGARAVELSPNDQRVVIIDASLKFRDAVRSGDAQARRDVVLLVEELFEKFPENSALPAILIEHYAIESDYESALEIANRGLEAQPQNVELHLARLNITETLGEIDALEGYLVELNERFPDERDYQQMMIRYFGLRGEVEKAEAFLREIASPLDDDLTEYTSLVVFLRDTQGNDAALAELDAGLQARPDDPTLSALRATLLFDSGEREKGIADLEQLLQSEDLGSEALRIKISLARMLLATENEVGARKLVEEVLAEDALQTEAVKLQANWMILDDRSTDAINILRRALDSEPEDAELMTLMAQAHARNGDADISRDLLSLAAETSGFAPEESIRYARALIAVEEYATAETTLIYSLRARPDTPSVLAVLAEVYLLTKDWPRAEQVEETLRRLDTRETLEIADSLRIELLRQRQGTEEALSFLEDQLETGRGDNRALSALIGGYIQSGDLDSARNTLNAAFAENPGDPQLKLLESSLLLADGDLDGAEEIYRALLADYPNNEQLWIGLMRVVAAQQDPQEVARVLDQGLEQLPDAPNLLWAKASQLERALDIDGAIEVYEKLYDLGSNSVVAANNLASLLATYRADDPESVERAYAIARRLRGTENPAFQDTYGWIAYLRGDYEEAVTYLEPAAQALASDPVVQYHLGMLYLSLEQRDQAFAQFERALELAGADDPREQFVVAREKLVELENGAGA
nr:tetratricopeptide repeat protein [Dinoroseobacter sp.]